jgi:hypothetical protein
MVFLCEALRGPALKGKSERMLLGRTNPKSHAGLSRKNARVQDNLEPLGTALRRLVCGGLPV